MSNETLPDDLRDEYTFDAGEVRLNRFAAGRAAKLHQRKGVLKTAPASPGDVRRMTEAADAYARRRESAAAEVSEANSAVARLAADVPGDADCHVVGPIVHCVDYGPSEPVTYFAAGVHGRAGVGAYEFCYSPESDRGVAVRDFLPFSDCPPALQVHVASVVHELVAQLKRQLQPAA